MDRETAITPSQVNAYIKELLEGDTQLFDIWIVGELTNVKLYKLGQQLYFNLSDGQSQLNCVMYSSSLSFLKFQPKDGIKVVAKGSLKCFHKKGTYSFQTAFMMEIGQGNQSQSFEALKAKLHQEGLFEFTYKKEPPPYIEHLALLTSEDSAAMHDVCKLISDRCPFIRITLFPITVQGPTASASIISTLNHIRVLDIPFDALLLCRGGGSLEDLSCFNDEALIRTLFRFPIPTLSAIGHEVDYTLCDFVCDKRLETPTAAAHFICEPFLKKVAHFSQRLSSSLMSLHTSFAAYHSEFLDLLYSFDVAIEDLFSLYETRLNTLASTLSLLNPLRPFEQGFSISKANHKMIHSVSMLTVSDTLVTEFKDGTVYSIIHDIKTKDPL